MVVSLTHVLKKGQVKGKWNKNKINAIEFRNISIELQSNGLTIKGVMWGGTTQMNTKGWMQRAFWTNEHTRNRMEM